MQIFAGIPALRSLPVVPVGCSWECPIFPRGLVLTPKEIKLQMSHSPSINRGAKKKLWVSSNNLLKAQSNGLLAH